MTKQDRTESSYRPLWKFHISGILIGAILGGCFGWLIGGEGSIMAGAIVFGFLGEIIGLLIARGFT
jgi:uncharacterized protein YcfJ